jgi:hypothetical protein
MHRARLAVFTARNANEVGHALDGIAAAGVGGVNVLGSPMLNGARRRNAVRGRKEVYCARRSAVVEGGAAHRADRPLGFPQRVEPA